MDQTFHRLTENPQNLNIEKSSYSVLFYLLKFTLLLTKGFLKDSNKKDFFKFKDY